MPQKQRKFTNGYYPSLESDCDISGKNYEDESDVSVKLKIKKEEKVVDRVDKLRTKWNKVKHTRKHSKKENSELLQSVMPG